MRTVLLAFFSHSGNTRRLAETTARLLEARGFVVRVWEGKPRRAVSFLRAAFSAFLGLPMPVGEPRPGLPDFEVAAIGGPVWAFTIAPPVIDMVKKIGGRGALAGKQVVPFLTCEGNPGRAARSLARSIAAGGGKAAEPVVVVFKQGVPAEGLEDAARRLAEALTG